MHSFHTARRCPPMLVSGNRRASETIPEALPLRALRERSPMDEKQGNCGDSALIFRGNYRDSALIFRGSPASADCSATTASRAHPTSDSAPSQAAQASRKAPGSFFLPAPISSHGSTVAPITLIAVRAIAAPSPAPMMMVVAVPVAPVAMRRTPHAPMMMVVMTVVPH